MVMQKLRAGGQVDEHLDAMAVRLGLDPDEARQATQTLLLQQGLEKALAEVRLALAAKTPCPPGVAVVGPEVLWMQPNQGRPTGRGATLPFGAK